MPPQHIGAIETFDWKFGQLAPKMIFGPVDPERLTPLLP
jgi:hypothetical protein